MKKQKWAKWVNHKSGKDQWIEDQERKEEHDREKEDRDEDFINKQ